MILHTMCLSIGWFHTGPTVFNAIFQNTNMFLNILYKETKICNNINCNAIYKIVQYAFNLKD